MDVVPTHVHPNFDKLHWADIGDNYVPYNKPGSIKHWCARRAAPRCGAADARPRGRAVQPSSALGRGRAGGGWREAGVCEAARVRF